MLVYVVNANPEKPSRNPNNLSDIIPPQGKFIALTPKLQLSINRKELSRVDSVATTGEIQFDQKNKAHLAAQVSYQELNKENAYLSAKQSLIKNIDNSSALQEELKTILEKIELQSKLVLSSVENIESFKEEFSNEEDEEFIALVELQKTPTEAEKKAAAKAKKEAAAKAKKEAAAKAKKEAAEKE